MPKTSQSSCQGNGAATRSRVLDNAEARSEETGANLLSLLGPGPDIDVTEPGHRRRRHRRHLRRSSHLHHQVRTGHEHFGTVDRHQTGSKVGRYRLDWLIPGAIDPGRLSNLANLHGTHRGLDAPGVDRTQVQKNPGCPDQWVTGVRDLEGWSENPGLGHRPFKPTQEDRLGEGKIGGDLLHLVVVETEDVGYHAQRIATRSVPGEHSQHITMPWHPSEDTRLPSLTVIDGPNL